MRILISIYLSLMFILMTKQSYAECTEYKIIDNGDSVEAVCVGAPLSGSDKKEYDKLNDQQVEKDKRNAIIDCYAPLKKHVGNHYSKPAYVDEEMARCRKLEVDLSMYLGSRPKKPQSQTDDSYDDLTAQMQNAQAQAQAQMQQQQAEIQRQQMDIQRMQHQQKLNRY